MQQLLYNYFCNLGIKERIWVDGHWSGGGDGTSGGVCNQISSRGHIGAYRRIGNINHLGGNFYGIYFKTSRYLIFVLHVVVVKRIEAGHVPSLWDCREPVWPGLSLRPLSRWSCSSPSSPPPAIIHQSPFSSLASSLTLQWKAKLFYSGQRVFFTLQLWKRCKSC